MRPRYSKARGQPTLFVCGTDEYGTATETKALEEKCTPQQLCDKYHTLHKQVYDWFDIRFDIFGRTPTTQQTEIAQDIFLKLYKNGYLEERTTTQPFCEKHGSYLADRFVEGECPLCGYNDARGDQCDKCGKLLDPLDLKNPRCKLDGATPVPRDTKHVFILLDKLQPQIQQFVSGSTKKGAWSDNGVIITENWLKEGLRPRGITRDLRWGVPVPLPGFEDKVLYVWFEACIGYVSITANYTDEWERWWRDPEGVQLYQFMGKDNVPFHTVIFPGSQLGTGDRWTKLHHLSTTEYLNYEQGKFSKSRGVGVFGTNARDTGVPADVWRYYLLSRRPETGDSEFEWRAFIDANNNVLLKNLGNLVNRVIKFVNSPKTYGSRVPDHDSGAPAAGFDPAGWMREANALLQQYISEMEAVKLRAGLVTALHLCDLGNRLLQANTLDNNLFSQQPHKCAAVVGLALNLVHLLASVFEPYLPATAASILAQLQLPLLIIPDDWVAESVRPGHQIGPATHLFGQIKPEKEGEWREMFGGEEARRQREEKARKAAERKAAKNKKKEGKEGGETGKGHGESVEAVEKGGAQRLDEGPDGVAQVTSGVHQASLHPS